MIHSYPPSQVPQSQLPLSLEEIPSLQRNMSVREHLEPDVVLLFLCRLRMLVKDTVTL